MRLEGGEIAVVRRGILKATRRWWRIVFHCRLFTEVLRGGEDNLKQLLCAFALCLTVGRGPLAIGCANLLAQDLDRIRFDANLMKNVDIVKILVHFSQAERVHGALARRLQVCEGRMAHLEVIVLHFGQMVCVEHMLREQSI